MINSRKLPDIMIEKKTLVLMTTSTFLFFSFLVMSGSKDFNCDRWSRISHPVADNSSIVICEKKNLPAVYIIENLEGSKICERERGCFRIVRNNH